MERFSVIFHCKKTSLNWLFESVQYLDDVLSIIADVTSYVPIGSILGSKLILLFLKNLRYILKDC